MEATRQSIQGLTEQETYRLVKVATRGMSPVQIACWLRTHLPQQWAKWELEGSHFVYTVKSKSVPGKTYCVQMVNGEYRCNCVSREPKCTHVWLTIAESFHPYISPEELAAYRAEKAANRAA